MERSALMEFLRKNTALFADFDDISLNKLIDGSKVSTFEPNEAIIEFGDEGHFLGVILNGKAEVSSVDNAGIRRRIAELKTGDIFGEMALLTGDRTLADVIGITRCKALFVPTDIFSTQIVTNPSAIKYLSRLFAKRSRLVPMEEDNRELDAKAVARSSDPYGLHLKTEHPMRILVINCGSSSLKYNLFDTADETNNTRGIVERIGAEGTRQSHWFQNKEQKRDLPKGTHTEAFNAMLEELARTGTPVANIEAIGHRVVHGGDRFSGAEIITDTVLQEIEKLAMLAPLHNPVNVTGIREARRACPHAVQIAVFDTSFHQTIPPYAYLYGLPYDYYEKKHIRRYGFHGMSHSYVALKAAEFLKRSFNELELISCHLGNGASMCAIDHGRSVDTSMGLTPAEGLIMGTRAGDMDPAVIIHLMRTENMTVEQADELLNKKSGLLGISGLSNDMREIEKAAREGDHRSLLAFKTFCYRVRKYIGAYVAAMNGLDAVIFTGGIGQGSAGVRSLACQGLTCMGITLDEEKNRNAASPAEAVDISTADSTIRVIVVPTNEELMIARETIRTLSSRYITGILETQRNTPIPIEVSAHHVHLSQEHVEALFGAGYKLTKASDLSQPGQFACNEKVVLVGPKGKVERVRVLGPARKATQVEISMTEQFQLGIHPPVRESGDLNGTPGLTIEGTVGKVVLDKGVICAMRHIHMPPEDALRYGLRDKYVVRVRVVGGNRELIFGDILVRVHPNFKLAMHIDTDEANAADIKTGNQGFIEGIQGRN
ncbi:MAG: acetate/propionate family kinase [Kiritimatiellae bacterium]|nr:acetate/propionate family kinase [Kiritimatiellia bacterium]MDD5521046.1 acetate/propionate family kinase [Kiritimatiellia bacterium]